MLSHELYSLIVHPYFHYKTKGVKSGNLNPLKASKFPSNLGINGLDLIVREGGGIKSVLMLVWDDVLMLNLNVSLRKKPH